MTKVQVDNKFSIVGFWVLAMAWATFGTYIIIITR
jgi:hypothetical protein